MYRVWIAPRYLRGGSVQYARRYSIAFLSTYSLNFSLEGWGGGSAFTQCQGSGRCGWEGSVDIVASVVGGQFKRASQGGSRNGCVGRTVPRLISLLGAKKGS
jgi:hypothetical protein